MIQLPSLRSIIHKYELFPKKNLGQNFLLDSAITDKIVKVAQLKAGQNILEIGPGPGGLTRSILKMNPAELIVIEQDERFLGAMQELQQIYPQLVILNDDALAINEKEIISSKSKIIANLPYNIGTALLCKWLENLNLWQDFTLMLQNEVAERIIAKPKTKDYGRLSVICQLLCHCEIHFTLAPEAFYPPPKVTSAVVSLYPKDIQPSADIIRSVQFIAKILFNQRRKMLRSTLKAVHADINSLVYQTDIELTQRPEELSIEQFVQLAQNYRDCCS